MLVVVNDSVTGIIMKHIIANGSFDIKLVIQ